jgi:hypothetical protein
MRYAHYAFIVPVLGVLVMLATNGAGVHTVRASEAGCPPGGGVNTDVLLCDDFDEGNVGDRWVIGSRGGLWPLSQFVVCGTGFGFNDRCAAWSNYLLFDGAWGFWGYNGLRTFPSNPELYIRWYQYISTPYTWGALEDKSIILQDPERTLTTYVGTSRNHFPVVPNSGPGMPFVANYRDVDLADTGGQFTRVNRFQNQGNDITLQPGRWYLFEWHIKMNTPGVSDGVTRLWVDDASGPIATQTLRLHYTDMMWLRQGDEGKQYNSLQLTVYNQRCDGIPNTCPPNGPSMLKQSQRWDRLVVSKAPIGPLPVPATTISSPLSDAIVSGTIPIEASVTIPDAAGVQFEVDGAPVAPEDTSPPYSVLWDTTTVSDGPHVLTARVRDGTGALAGSGRVPVAVVNVGSVTRLEETSGGVAFTPPDTWLRGNTHRPWSEGTAALGFASGQRVTFSFGGTGVSWLGFRGPQTGVAWVYLDGALSAIVDGYSATEVLQARLFTASGLAPGPHTLAIEVPDPRTRHHLSTDYYTVVDAFDVIGTAPGGTAYSGISEETSDAMTYTGAWIAGNTHRAWSGGTAALGFAEGQRATLEFSGTSVRWIGFRGPQTGVARVYLDNVLMATVDAYAAVEELQAELFSVANLPAGLHWLTIEVAREKHAASSDYYVVLDAFDVQ